MFSRIFCACQPFKNRIHTVLSCKKIWSRCFLKRVDNMKHKSERLVLLIRASQTFPLFRDTYIYFYCACQMPYSNCFSLVKWIFDLLLSNFHFYKCFLPRLDRMLEGNNGETLCDCHRYSIAVFVQQPPFQFNDMYIMIRTMLCSASLTLAFLTDSISIAPFSLKQRRQIYLLPSI